MLIESVYQLHAEMLTALNGLLRACWKTDKATIPTYPHLIKEFRAGLPSLLCFENNQLIGFLAGFFFYNDAIEISLMIHPEYRQKGLASKLWQMLITHLKHNKVLNRLIITSPSGIYTKLLTHHGFHLTHTEVDMVCIPYTPDELQVTLSAADREQTFIREATMEDLDNLCAINTICFESKWSDPTMRMRTILQTPNLSVFVCVYQGQCIGQVHLVFEPNQVRLTDLAVLPEVQYKGFGRLLVLFALGYVHERKHEKLCLSVEITKKHALKLYQDTGFKIYNAVDYYEKSF